MTTLKKNLPFTVQDGEKVELNNPARWQLQGFSKAGHRTGFMLYPYHILLDAAIHTIKTPKLVLLTHSHIDHTWNLPHISGKLKTYGNQGEMIPVVFPARAEQGLNKLLDAAMTLSYPEESFTVSEMWERHFLQPHPVSPGTIFRFSDLKIETLPAVHVVESFGYGVSKETKKIKSQYFDYSTAALKELSERGVEIYDWIEHPELAFFCDSTIENLTNYDNWKKYPVIVVESTGFLEVYPEPEMQKRSHTHFVSLKAVIDKHPEKQWIIIHTSTKATNELLDSYRKTLPENVRIFPVSW